MQIRELAVQGSWEITPKQLGDPRGLFLEWFKAETFQQVVGRPLGLQQANCSVSAAGVVRGIHFADVPPSRIAGAIMITDGEVHDAPDKLAMRAPLQVLIAGNRGERDRKLTVTNAERFAIVGQSAQMVLRVDDFGGGGSGNASTGTNTAQGSATKPLPKPSKFQQAPNIDSSLPPVEERLPENPYVIPHKWVKPGKYGGKLNMNVFSSSGATTAESDREFFYGHSPLRWLNDGKDVGPGLVETWETNDDTSEWTFHFRKGLKWSDGKPWTTQDILFWWEDFVLPQKMAQAPPDETRSGKGTLAKFEAVDDVTLKLTFDTPAPLTADRMAAYCNGNVGKNGATWMMPSHYLKQFHPKYNKKVPKDWDTVGGLMEGKADWHRNPDCPTMIGYTCKSFDTNKGVVLERNPYYWAVMPNGDQLPYIDEIQFTVITDPEAGKLQVQQGSVDYCHGPFNQITLGDVEGLRNSGAKAGTELILWDSGSGTGSIFFFNYDYIDDDIRALIREPKFRQAISYAFNREAVQKSVYFNTGEKTTGTHGTKAAEFVVNAEGKKFYQQWRDAYVAHDPEKAKQLLDELGVKDSDGDGKGDLRGATQRLDYVSQLGVDAVVLQPPFSADDFGDFTRAASLAR